MVIGDSIPYNSPDDCADCVGFVDQYAEELADTTGEEVVTQNLSEHTGLTLPGLMAGMTFLEEDLRAADVIVVGIAHNSFPLSAARPCGSAFDEAASTIRDWTKVDTSCGRAATERYGPKYDKLFATIAGWRADQPTILLALDKYNDWNGWRPAHLTPEQVRKTVVLHDMWNRMLCAAAERNGFTCVDVYRAFNGPDGTRPSGELLAEDYTHPSQEGNDAIADLLVEAGFEPLTSGG